MLFSILTVLTFFSLLPLELPSVLVHKSKTHKLLILFFSHISICSKTVFSTWNLLLNSPYLVLYWVSLFPQPDPYSMNENFLSVILF